jgi:cysteine desulfurase family protein
VSSHIYLDNAATSWPKPPSVGAAITRYLEQVGANPGRSGHSLSIKAGRIVDSARESLSELFHIDNPLRIVFGSNGTEALNLALCGLLRPGDHAITSSMEHNSVMRPLRHLEKEGMALTVVPCKPDGTLDCSLIEAAIRPNTTLIGLTHASNVIGTLLPIAAVGHIARKHHLLMLVDTASTAGAIPINMDRDCIDLLAFTGHKSLLGPTGTGGLVIGERVDISRLRPLKRGGTGSRSESEEQPEILPDRYESGTLNIMGLAGLDAGVRWILGRGIDAIRAHHQEMTQSFIGGLADISGVTVYGTLDSRQQVGTVSFNINGVSPSEAGFYLDEEFDIQCRVGLHCAPAAHQTIGTFPIGTVRFAPGVFTSTGDLIRVLDAVEQIARRAK